MMAKRMIALLWTLVASAAALSVPATPRTADVGVIGAGPAGLVLAHALARRKVPAGRWRGAVSFCIRFRTVRKLNLILPAECGININENTQSHSQDL